MTQWSTGLGDVSGRVVVVVVGIPYYVDWVAFKSRLSAFESATSCG